MPDPSLNAQEKGEARAAWRWPLPPPVTDAPDLLGPHTELHALSNFSFQRGASHPAELVVQAYRLGYRGLALTDECSVAGVVRAHMALKDYEAMLLEAEQAAPGLRYKRAFSFIPGSEFALPGLRLVVLPHDLVGWGQLCELISHARRRSDIVKGDYRVDWDDAWASLADCEVLCVPERHPAPDALALRTRLRQLRQLFGTRLWLGLALVGATDDALWLRQMRQLSVLSSVPLVAAGGVLMHARSRKKLQDVLTAVRLKTPVALRFRAGAERRTPAALARDIAPDLSGRAAGRHRDRARTLQLQPAGDRLPLSPGDLAARLHADPGTAPADLCRRPAAALPGADAREDPRPGRERAATHRRLPVRDVLSDRARHRAFRAQPRHLVPGPRLGRELGGLLLPGHHGRQPRAFTPADGALHQQGAPPRAARHRCRFRARAA